MEYSSPPWPSTITIESPYISGLSLTHGIAGERKHVWSFAGAWDEASAHSEPQASCSCINTTSVWPFHLPSTVGNSYFCDAAAHDLHEYLENGNIILVEHQNSPDKVIYLNNPLWDGEECGGSSTRCRFNNPPWFCKDLKYYTTDNLEIRLCSTALSPFEDKLIYLVELYVK